MSAQGTVCLNLTITSLKYKPVYYCFWGTHMVGWFSVQQAISLFHFSFENWVCSWFVTRLCCCDGPHYHCGFGQNAHNPPVAILKLVWAPGRALSDALFLPMLIDRDFVRCVLIWIQIWASTGTTSLPRSETLTISDLSKSADACSLPSS